MISLAQDLSQHAGAAPGSVIQLWPRVEVDVDRATGKHYVQVACRAVGPLGLADMVERCRSRCAALGLDAEVTGKAP